MKSKTFKISVLRLGEETNKVKCLFCDNYPVFSCAFAIKPNPAILYFICWEHSDDNVDITPRNRRIASSIELIYRQCLEQNFQNSP